MDSPPLEADEPESPSVPKRPWSGKEESAKRLRVGDLVDQIEDRCAELSANAPRRRRSGEVQALLAACKAALPDAAEQPALLRRLDAALAALEATLGFEATLRGEGATPASREWLATYAGTALESDMPVLEALHEHWPVPPQALEAYVDALISRTFGPSTRVWQVGRESRTIWQLHDPCSLRLIVDDSGKLDLRFNSQRPQGRLQLQLWPESASRWRWQLHTDQPTWWQGPDVPQPGRVDFELTSYSQPERIVEDFVASALVGAKECTQAEQPTAREKLSARHQERRTRQQSLRQ